jgi:hypothetical protein
MPTYMDESGDTGPRPGGSPYFRLAAVWVPTLADAEGCRASIQAVRGEIGVGPRFEFKFAKTHRHPVTRQAFFTAVLKHPFRFVVCAYAKPLPPLPALSAAEIYWGCSVVIPSYLRMRYLNEEAARTAALGQPTALDDTVTVDDNRDRDYLAALKRGLRAMESRAKPGGKLIGKVKFKGSGPDDMIQCADMVVGAVGASLDGDHAWYDLIRDRCDGIVHMP